ncbi:MarR family winged helix-turn-helix transcriptional regulator [Saccharopolyspora rosea]|uniref:MarR family winged helix-turn-helix transcriptional regulator n=1 Tax=Saccharopolyspora rosea TaxID=524884 RepID=A0ABW3FNW6_9PSEU|nr:MarR family transcriptional regulator [Saccharopolyspora rosea]
MRETGKRATGQQREATSDEEGVEELAQAADRLFYAMRRSRAATAGQSAVGLSWAQLALLAPLAEDGRGDGLPVGKLAAHAEVSVPTATRMLNQLEANGVIVRRRCEHDERQVLIHLTDDGTRRLATMRDELRARQRRALSRYTPHERRALAAQLHELAEIIAETMTGPAR